MDSLLKQHVSFVQRLRTSHTNVSIVEVIQMLDDIVQFLNTTPNQTNGLHVLTIICHDFASINVLKLFDNKTIMQHQFFLLIQRTLEMFLTKATFITMTKEDEQCWYEISHLVVQLCLFNNHQLFSSSDENSINQISYENIFLTKSFFERFTRIILSDLILNDYQPYHIKYKVLNHLLYLSTEVLNINHHLLYDSIVQCLSSHLYLNVFETIDFQQSRINPKQYFLLYQCPQFIQVHSHQHLNEISNSSCQLLLENTSKIFQQHLLLFSLEDKVENRQGKVQAISWHIELLNHLALTPTTRKYFSQDMYQTIVDQLINVLRTECLIERLQNKKKLYHANVMLISSAITLVYSLMFEEEIFRLLKNNGISKFCIKLHKVENRRIQFASQTLSTILNQEDIDQINDPIKMAENYLFYLGNSIDKPSQIYNGIKLENILANLQIIVQNDLIKARIGSDQNGLSLLIRCVLDQSMDLETIQYPALHILDVLSFENKSMCQKINKNEKLMNWIKHLSDMDESILRSTANRIRWKVKDEEKFILKQIETQDATSIKGFDDTQSTCEYMNLNYHWDLFDKKTSNMFYLLISYHPRDIEICRQISHYLSVSNFHQVLFDTEHIQGMLPEVMAEAIEKSSIVLICFSNQYQQSCLCRLEAEYAQKRKRTIIPVNLDEFYHPTGWLKNIIADKLCIEFNASNFSNACASLIGQINNLKEKSI